MKYFCACIVLVLFFIACDKEDTPPENFRLEGWTLTGNAGFTVNDTFSVVYNDDNTVKEAMHQRGYATRFTYVNGQLIKKERFSPTRLNSWEEYVYKDGKLVQVDKYSGSPVSHNRDSLVYTGNKLAEVHQLPLEGTNSTLTKERIVYEWNGDNVSRLTIYHHHPGGNVTQGVRRELFYNNAPNYLHETMKGGFNSLAEFDYEYMNARSLSKVVIYGFGSRNGIPMVHTKTFDYYTSREKLDSIRYVWETDYQDGSSKDRSYTVATFQYMK